MKKILYTINSLSIIKNLISLGLTSYIARILSRVFIIRMDDFIKLAREYNNANTTDPKLKKKIKQELTALNNLYEEYLKEQRHKLGAHFQDKDLFDRVQLWTSIDESKIAFFYKEIIDIYVLFENVLGYKKINTNILILSEEKQKQIKKLVKEEDSLSEVKTSSDILSISRPNMTTLLTCHPVNEKMQSLNSVVMFYDFLRKLYELIREIPEYERVIKAQIATDCISFKDNLIHKEDSQDIGLDYLMDRDMYPYKKIIPFKKCNTSELSLSAPRRNYIPYNGYNSAITVINNFKEKVNDDVFTSVLNLRNKLGAHIDTTITYDNLIELVNSVKMKEIDEAYMLLINMWQEVGRTCNSLMHLTFKPLSIKGITAYDSYQKEGFYKNQIEKVDIKKPKVFKSYEEAFERILITFAQDEDAVNFFNEGFKKSNVILTTKITCEDGFKLEYSLTKSGMILLKKLSSDCEIKIKRFLLNYLNDYCGMIGYENCSSVLISSMKKCNDTLLTEYIVLLGNIGKNSDFVVEYLKYEALQHSDNSFNALIALFKIDIRDNGLFYVNNRKREPQNSKSSLFIKEFLLSFDSTFKIIMGTLLTSEMYFGVASYNQHYTSKIYQDFLDELVYEGFTKLKKAPIDEMYEIIKCNHKNRFLTLTLYSLVECLEDKNIINFVYSLIANENMTLNYKINLFLEHRAYALYKLNRIDESLNIYMELISREPSNIVYHIKRLGYIVETQDDVFFKTEKESIMKKFNLADEEKKEIDNLEEELKRICNEKESL